MTRLKLTVNANTNKDLEYGHIPSFLSRNTKSVSVAFRKAGDFLYEERWVANGTYSDGAVEATEFETRVYRDTKDADFLLQMDEPDDLKVHSADEWEDFNDASNVIQLVA